MARPSFASLFLSTVVVAALLVSPSAADICEKSRSGAPCEIDGKPSRCWNSTCRALPQPCASGRKELQSCDDEFGICTQFTDKKQLHCVDLFEVGYYKNYDACDGKTDGATCTPVSGAISQYSTSALFAEKPGQCKDHFCDPEVISRCHGKAAGTACEFDRVLYGFLYKGSGACAQSEPKEFQLMFCNMSDNVRMTAVAPVAPVQVYDNRRNVSDPTNLQTADLCDFLREGAPCTHPTSGATSRCRGTDCAWPEVACPKGAKPLDKCELPNSLTSYCLEYVVEGQLTCVREEEVRDALSFDSCIGKKDGDACDAVDYSFSNDIPTFYKLPKGMCHRQKCRGDDAQACEFSKHNDTCSADKLSDGKIVTVKGACAHTSFGYLVCRGNEQAYKDAQVVGPATAIPTEKLVVKALKPPKLEPTASVGEHSGAKTSAATKQNVAIGSALSVVLLSAVLAL